MEFLLFDVAATLVFLLGYLTAVTLRQARAPLVLTEPAAAPRPSVARARGTPRPSGETRHARPGQRDRREWPRLIYPR
jgi:hypothetical protein